MTAAKSWVACLAGAMLLCLSAAQAVAAAGAAPLAGKRVLLLYSYNSEFPSSAAILEGVQSVFAEAGVHVDTEFMDSKRIPDDALRENFRQLLAVKLARLPPYDLVMVSDDNAFGFAREHHDSLFAGLPVVFLHPKDACGTLVELEEVA